MIQLDDSIHVLYGSNTVDIWMITATLLTFASSLVLGVAAWKNGTKATRIAKEASDRDEEHRKTEARRKTDEARHQAALAMVRAINAVISTSAKPRKIKNPDSTKPDMTNPLRDSARVEEDVRIAEAKALASLLLPETSSPNARDWFSHMVEHFRGLTTPERHEEFKDRREELFSLIAKWNNDPSSLDEMLTFDFKGNLTREEGDWCDGSKFVAKANPS